MRPPAHAQASRPHLEHLHHFHLHVGGSVAVAITVTVTALAAGVAAGLAVLCLPPVRRDDDPTARLSRVGVPRPVRTPAATRIRRRISLLRTIATRRGAHRRHTAESARLAPLAADLLAACLASGSTPPAAAEAVGHALQPATRPGTATEQAAFDLASRFHEVAALLRLGGNPTVAWRPLGAEPGLLPLAQAAARAGLTGAPPAEAVAWTADDLRVERHCAGTAGARQAGVRAVGPLTGCFLPAFLLIGVVPVVIGLAERLLP